MFLDVGNSRQPALCLRTTRKWKPNQWRELFWIPTVSKKNARQFYFRQASLRDQVRVESWVTKRKVFVVVLHLIRPSDMRNIIDGP
jgi:hypothetical protein